MRIISKMSKMKQWNWTRTYVLFFFSDTRVSCYLFPVDTLSIFSRCFVSFFWLLHLRAELQVAPIPSRLILFPTAFVGKKMRVKMERYKFLDRYCYSRRNQIDCFGQRKNVGQLRDTRTCRTTYSKYQSYEFNKNARYKIQ